MVGSRVGEVVGRVVGRGVGASLGDLEGGIVGTCVGEGVGLFVGAAVGAFGLLQTNQYIVDQHVPSFQPPVPTPKFITVQSSLPLALFGSPPRQFVYVVGGLGVPSLHVKLPSCSISLNPIHPKLYDIELAASLFFDDECIDAKSVLYIV